MSIIQGKILAEDVRNSKYIFNNDCAITRALKRAGYPHFQDWGGCMIDTTKLGIGENSIVIPLDNLEYAALDKKVRAMYVAVGQCSMSKAAGFEPIEPHDFEFTINY